MDYLSLSLAFKVAQGLILLFLILCSLRIVLSWFPLPRRDLGGLRSFLGAATQWYLGWFSRFAVFRLGMFDFSSFVAVALLIPLAQGFGMLAAVGRLSWGYLLGTFAYALWSPFALVLFIQVVLHLVRLAVYISGLPDKGPILEAVVRLTDPVMLRLRRLIFRRRLARYWLVLTLSLLFMAAALVLGELLFRFLAELLNQLPI